MKKFGFTLAEVLITLAIIGVVAALTIPSVVANTQQQEFKTGLRKAVSVLNSAITMNMALDGETPYENKNLYGYLGRHMSVIKTNVLAPAAKNVTLSNVSFYTTDGMRFEFPYYNHTREHPLYLNENKDIALAASMGNWSNSGGKDSVVTPANNCLKTSEPRCSFCGSYGLTNNVDNTTTPPCLIIADVNGDRKPFPKNASCFSTDRGNAKCANDNPRKYSDIRGRKLTDTFSIMITDKQAIPYGVAAQKAMYEAQK